MLNKQGTTHEKPKTQKNIKKTKKSKINIAPFFKQ